MRFSAKQVLLCVLVALPFIVADSVECPGGITEAIDGHCPANTKEVVLLNQKKCQAVLNKPCPDQVLGLVVDTSDSRTGYANFVATQQAISKLLSLTQLPFRKYLLSTYSTPANKFKVSTAAEISSDLADKKFQGNMRNMGIADPPNGQGHNDFKFAMDSALAQLQYFEKNNLTGTIIVAADDEQLCDVANRGYGDDSVVHSFFDPVKALATKLGVNLVYQVFRNYPEGTSDAHLWCPEADYPSTKALVKMLTTDFTFPADVDTLTKAILAQPNRCTCDRILSVLIDSSDSMSEYTQKLQYAMQVTMAKIMTPMDVAELNKTYQKFLLSTYAMPAADALVYSSFDDVLTAMKKDIYFNVRKTDQYDADSAHQHNDYDYMLDSVEGALKLYEQQFASGKIVIAADDEQLCDTFYSNYASYLEHSKQRSQDLAARAKLLNIDIVFHAFYPLANQRPWCDMVRDHQVATAVPRLLASNVVAISPMDLSQFKPSLKF